MSRRERAVSFRTTAIKQNKLDGGCALRFPLVPRVQTQAESEDVNQKGKAALNANTTMHCVISDR